MTDAHLTEEMLAALLGEDRTEEENQLLLHHLAICPECYAVGGYILDLYRAGAIDLSFSVVDIGLGKSRAEVPVLWKKLSEKSLREQRQATRRSPPNGSKALKHLQLHLRQYRNSLKVSATEVIR